MLGMTNDRRYLGTKKLRGGFFSLVIGKNRDSAHFPLEKRRSPSFFLAVLTVILASRNNKVKEISIPKRTATSERKKG